MAKFNNNDDDFNDDEFNNEGDDFSRRWEEFNNMMNDREFKRDYNKFRSDLEELMRLISSRRREEGGLPINFRFMPLNDPSLNDLNNDFNIPDNEMDIEKGKDENGEWETKHWSSPDGSMSFTSFTRSSGFGDNNNSGLPDEIAEMFGKLRNREYNKRMDPEEAKKIKLAKLKKTLNYLVEEEKYEKAAEVKKMIEEIENPSAATEGENNT